MGCCSSVQGSRVTQVTAFDGNHSSDPLPGGAWPARPATQSQTDGNLSVRTLGTEVGPIPTKYKLITVPTQLLFLDKLLGRGPHADVFRGELWQNSVAVKVPRSSDLTVTGVKAPVDRERWLTYQRTLRAVRHPNVAQFHGYSVQGAMVCMIWEFAESTVQRLMYATSRPQVGCLCPPSAHTQGPQLTPAKFFDILIGVATGLSHLHVHGVAHGNVKASNVLLADDFTPRLVDPKDPALLRLPRPRPLTTRPSVSPAPGTVTVSRGSSANLPVVGLRDVEEDSEDTVQQSRRDVWLAQPDLSSVVTATTSGSGLTSRTAATTRSSGCRRSSASMPTEDEWKDIVLVRAQQEDVRQFGLFVWQFATTGILSHLGYCSARCSPEDCWAKDDMLVTHSRTRAGRRLGSRQLLTQDLIVPGGYVHANMRGLPLSTSHALSRPGNWECQNRAPRPYPLFFNHCPGLFSLVKACVSANCGGAERLSMPSVLAILHGLRALAKPSAPVVGAATRTPSRPAARRIFHNTSAARRVKSFSLPRPDVETKRLPYVTAAEKKVLKAQQDAHTQVLHFFERLPVRSETKVSVTNKRQLPPDRPVSAVELLSPLHRTHEAKRIPRASSNSQIEVVRLNSISRSQSQGQRPMGSLGTAHKPHVQALLGMRQVMRQLRRRAVSEVNREAAKRHQRRRLRQQPRQPSRPVPSHSVSRRSSRALVSHRRAFEEESALADDENTVTRVQSLLSPVGSISTR